jgi:hypothetical protein
VAILVARLTGSRRSRGVGIPQRSCIGRLRDPVIDAFVALVLKQRRKDVREMRMVKIKEEVQKG